MQLCLKIKLSGGANRMDEEVREKELIKKILDGDASAMKYLYDCQDRIFFGIYP